MKQKHIINCPCYDVASKKEIEDFILEKINQNQGGYTVAINALKIVKYNNDPIAKDVIDKAILQIPDGFGAVYAFKLLHKIKTIRVDLPGITLDLANEKRMKVFFLGASEENNLLAVENVKKLYPGIQITGRQNGFFKNFEDVESQLAETMPEIVLIGMGSPRQEILSSKFHQKFKHILFIGCGGRIDVLSGNIKRAPQWYIRNKLEGVYRVATQPRRIYDLRKVIIYFYLLYKTKWFTKTFK
ncbi:MAG: WecB/TagA/CpsF family glycosyltransferase [Bacteroidota bacterium]